MHRVHESALPGRGLSMGFVRVGEGEGEGPGPHRHPYDEVVIVREDL